MDLLQACVTSPDDDAPRLDWARATGGERGELVVVQCDLARGGLPREASISRRRREAVLLGGHGPAWANLDGLADGWLFRRGFVEEAVVHAKTFAEKGAELFAKAPLLRHVELSGLDDGTPEQIVALLDGVLKSPHFARLRGLRMSWVGRTVDTDRDTKPREFESAGSPALAHVIKSGALKSLRSLQIPCCALSTADIRGLAQCPEAAGLVELDVRHQQVDMYMGIYPGDVQLLLDSPNLAGLDALDLGGSLGRAPWLAGQTRDERAEASRQQSKRDPALVAHPRIQGLRRLGLSDCSFADEMIDALAAAPFPRLDRLDLSKNDVFPQDFTRLGAAPGYDRLVELVFDGPSRYVFGPKMSAALGGASRLGALRILRLRNCFMNLEAAKALLASPLARRLELIDLRQNSDLAKQEGVLKELFDGILLLGS